jgi:hypothetical protein
MLVFLCYVTCRISSWVAIHWWRSLSTANLKTTHTRDGSRMFVACAQAMNKLCRLALESVKTIRVRHLIIMRTKLCPPPPTPHPISRLHWEWDCYGLIFSLKIMCTYNAHRPLLHLHFNTSNCALNGEHWYNSTVIRSNSVSYRIKRGRMKSDPVRWPEVTNSIVNLTVDSAWIKICGRRENRSVMRLVRDWKDTSIVMIAMQ